MKELLFETPAQWRRWLAANHAAEKGIWVVFAKPASRLRSITYQQALDEALCYGWIDSIIHRIDDERYARKFTPRKPTSHWSDINKKRFKELIQQGRVRPAGRRAVELSKEAGSFRPKSRPQVSGGTPRQFLTALKANPTAHAFFQDLPKSEKQRFILWIQVAKRKETKERRIRESIVLLAHREKLGLR